MARKTPLDEVKGDINVTPLVDVCLVLLIIFMVVTPMLQSGIDVMLPAGPSAEKKPGAENDLEMVTRIARSMVGRWGMSERIGTLSVLPAEGDPRMAGVSDALLDAVDEEVRRITEECYAEARRLLRANRDKLDAIVAQLLKHESLDEPEIYAAAGIPRPVTTPTPPPVPA